MAKPGCRGKAGEDITNFSRAQVTDAIDPVDAVIRALRLRPLVAERRATALRTFPRAEVTDVTTMKSGAPAGRSHGDSLLEAVTHTGLGQQVPGVRRVILELAS